MNKIGDIIKLKDLNDNYILKQLPNYKKYVRCEYYRLLNFIKSFDKNYDHIVIQKKITAFIDEEDKKGYDWMFENFRFDEKYDNTEEVSIYMIRVFIENIEKILSTIKNINIIPLLNNDYKYTINEDKKIISREYELATTRAKKLSLVKHNIKVIEGKNVCNLYEAGFRCDNGCSCHFDNICNLDVSHYEDIKELCQGKIISNDNKNKFCEICSNNTNNNELFFLHKYIRKIYCDGEYYARLPNIFYENERKKDIKEILYGYTTIGKGVIDIITSYYS